MAKSDKEEAVREIAERLKRAKGVYLTDFTGLKVSELNELRRRCREAGVEYRVVKNTFTRLAVREADLECLLDYLIGPNAFSLGYEDPIAPAKVLKDFAKERALPRIKVGLLEGRLMSPEEVGRIADLPSREVLLSRVFSSFISPLYGFVLTVEGVLSSFLAVLEAVKSKKEKVS